MYDALELAKYIVRKCIIDKHPISNLQLQKILFFIQREFLRNKGHVAFYDEIQAWRFGPVVKNVYAYFCASGGMRLDFPLALIKSDIALEESDKKLIDKIVETCRIMDPWDLVLATHRKGGSWDRTYNSGAGFKKAIDVEWIRLYG